MPGRRTMLFALALALILAVVGHLAGRRNDEQSAEIAYLILRQGEALEMKRVSVAEHQEADVQLAASVSRRLAAGIPPDPPQRHEFTSLYAAVRYELPATARTLINAGADVNRRSFTAATPLWAAQKNNDVAMVGLLKQAGARK